MMLKVPPPTRVPLGALQIAGQKVELILSPEWARYFESLNSQVMATSEGLARSEARAALAGDGQDVPDSFPGPPGPPGLQGDHGLPLFLLQDDQGEQAMLFPPSVDGVYVPLNSKDAPDGVPALTQLKLNLKNAAGTITSWFTTAATAARTWTMPDKSGTVAMVGDFAAPPAIGNTTPAAGSFTSLNATEQITSTLATGTPPLSVQSRTQVDRLNVELLQGKDWGSPKPIGDYTPNNGTFTNLRATDGFGCNGKAPQGPVASGGTLAGVIAALVANGILSS